MPVNTQFLLQTVKAEEGLLAALWRLSGFSL